MKRLVVSIAIFAIPLTLGAQASEVQVGDKTRRPLSEAADLLEAKFGWIVTYEDVPVVGPDIEDITALARPLTANSPHRTLVPNGVPFAFVLDESKANQPGQTGAPSVIAAIVEAYNKSGNPGQFRVLAVRVPSGPVVYHLVPFEMREQGQPKPHVPLLDTRITVASGKRSLYATLDEIGRQLKASTSVQFDWGPYAFNYLTQTYVDFQAQNEAARDVLRALLVGKTGQRPLSWWMFCDPHGELCSLNVHEVGAIHTHQ